MVNSHHRISYGHARNNRGTTIAACEAVWLKRLLKYLGVPIQYPILLYCDNMSTNHLACNPVFHAHTMHIEVHYYIIRECLLVGDIDLRIISTTL